MVRARRGAGSMGCLFVLLLLAAGVYFALPVGEAWFKYYKYEDKMKQAVRFARLHQDSDIAAGLRAYADSIGLPEEAHDVTVQRERGRISVSSDYTEEFVLPGYVRVQRFTPRAEGTY